MDCPLWVWEGTGGLLVLELHAPRPHGVHRFAPIRVDRRRQRIDLRTAGSGGRRCGSPRARGPLVRLAVAVTDTSRKGARASQPAIDLMSLVFVLDVDNTLLDNDALKERLDAMLKIALGADDVARFWQLYEEVRLEMGLVNLRETVERFLPTHCDDPLAPQKVAEILFGLDFAACLRPGALELLERVGMLSTTVILSNGDQFFQRWKIWRSGLAGAAGGRVWVFPEKEQHFEDFDSRFGDNAHFVLVEDKVRALRAAQAHWGDRVTTVLVAFGHHAATVGASSEADLVVGSPVELVERLDELRLPPG